jgi:hypothetical protein
MAELMTGSIAARGVEPQDGEATAADGHTHEAACLNCKTPLVGPHCHSCGQRAHVHRTLGSLIHDLAHGVLHFEGKIWRTLPMLAWCPGDVTRRYIAGERARFVSPLALFLFSVFLLAAVLSSLPGMNVGDGFATSISEGNAKVRENERRATAELSATQAQLKQPGLSESQRGTLLTKQSKLQDELRGIRVLQSSGPVDLSAEDSAGEQRLLSAVNERWRAAKANPQLLVYKVKTSAYKYSWVLVPMSLPFLWLLFPFSRKFGMYDHAIFVIYSLASMSLLAVLLACIGQIPGAGQLAGLGFMLLPPVHMYRQLRGAYSLRRRSALWRTAVLLVCASQVFSLWCLGLILLESA